MKLNNNSIAPLRADCPRRKAGRTPTVWFCVHKSAHLFLTLALLFSSSGLAASSSKTPAVSPSLLDAIRQVESSGGRYTIGDKYADKIRKAMK